VLKLYREYPGQPIAEHLVQGVYGVLSTTVTSGQIALTLALAQANFLQSFSTRFAGYELFRIVQVTAKIRCFSSVNPGILVMWFDEDNSATATNALAVNAMALKFPASSVEKIHQLTYTPHDPAQQTFTTVAAGNPTIGYFKLYTDNTNYGASIVATQYLHLELDCVVQFRGFI
jgi:hypothetical protein